MAPITPPKWPDNGKSDFSFIFISGCPHVTAYCTSCKKKQDLPSGCSRKVLSWSCCREDSCRNCFSMTRTLCAELHVWLQNPVKMQDVGIASHSGHERRTTSFLSRMTHCFFLCCLLQTMRMVGIPLEPEGDCLPCHEYHAWVKWSFIAAHKQSNPSLCNQSAEMHSCSSHPAASASSTMCSPKQRNLLQPLPWHSCF